MRAIVLCNDALLRDGLHCLVAGLPWCASVRSESSFAPVRESLAESPVDAVVVAIEAVDISDLAGLESTKREFGFQVVAVAAMDTLPAPMEQIADRVVNRGQGFEGLRAALRSIKIDPPKADLQVREPLAGYGSPRQLTQREREVARLVSQGLPNRGIAKVLGIREQSVKNLVSVVMRKLDCENRVQVALHLASPAN